MPTLHSAVHTPHSPPPRQSAHQPAPSPSHSHHKAGACEQGAWVQRQRKHNSTRHVTSQQGAQNCVSECPRKYQPCTNTPPLLAPHLSPNHGVGLRDVNITINHARTCVYRVTHSTAQRGKEGRIHSHATDTHTTSSQQTSQPVRAGEHETHCARHCARYSHCPNGYSARFVFISSKLTSTISKGTPLALHSSLTTSTRPLERVCGVCVCVLVGRGGWVGAQPKREGEDMVLVGGGDGGVADRGEGDTEGLACAREPDQI